MKTVKMVRIVKHWDSPSGEAVGFLLLEVSRTGQTNIPNGWCTYT